MITIPQLTPLDNAGLEGAKAGHHMATTLGNQWAAFWNRPPATVQAEIAAEPEKAAVFLAMQHGCAAVINPGLDAFNSYVDANGEPVFSRRVPTALPEGWAYTPETGFTYTPPPPPEEPVE